MLYNYYEAVKNDLSDLLNEYNYADYETIEDLREAIYNDAWTNDSVTGNGSGSYTFSTREAWDNLGDNLDLMEEAAAAFGDEPTIRDEWDHGPEWWDVSIRCYLLDSVLNELMEDIADDFDEAHQ